MNILCMGLEQKQVDQKAPETNSMDVASPVFYASGMLLLGLTTC